MVSAKNKDDSNYDDNDSDGTKIILPNFDDVDMDEALLFLGLASGSFLSGFSLGHFLGEAEGRCWLASTISKAIFRKVWENLNVVIVSGCLGVSIFALSSRKYWSKKK